MSDESKLECMRFRRHGVFDGLLFATMQGIAALVTAGIVSTEEVDTLVADAIGRFLHGPSIPA
jgi:hypothetical protein